MMNKFPIIWEENAMTIQKCPQYRDHDHYVFFCLSNCDDFAGIYNGHVHCTYSEEPKFIIPVVDKGD
jgi:hypothetical protein